MRMGAQPSASRGARSVRQAMAGLHSWAGLLLGWLLYAMFLTGAASYFREEISQWMRPEVPAMPERPPAPHSAAQALLALQELAPPGGQWRIELPGARSNVVALAWDGPQGAGRALLHPGTGARLAPRSTAGGEFFYYFHFSLHYLPRVPARWLVGLAAMSMLVALVTGVVTHRKLLHHFFTFRPGKGARSWLDAHNALSVLALPFHFMITYTGLVTLMTLYMPWGAQMALNTAEQRLALRAELTAHMPPGPASGAAAALPDVAAMVALAERAWGGPHVGRVVVDHPGDAAARVRVVHSDADRVSVSPRFLLFEGRSGALLERRDAASAAGQLHGVLYGLHLGRFAQPVLRWLYFLSGLAGAAMVATGLVLWAWKRRVPSAAAHQAGFGVRSVERLNVATIAGLPLAMAVFLWANRLLPASLADRSAWEIHLFFLAWGAAWLHALLRPVRRLWFQQFRAAAILLATLPVWNLFFSERNLASGLLAADTMAAAFDATLLVLAGACHALAIGARAQASRVP